MPLGRKINRKITDDYRLNCLPVEARLLYRDLIIHSDREGRLPADPKWVRNHFFPMDDFTPTQVEGWLNGLANSKKDGVGLLELYEVEGRKYMWLPGFKEEQGNVWLKTVYPHEAESSIPTPPTLAAKAQVSPPRKSRRAKTEGIVDEKLANMVKCYENNMTVITPSAFERLKLICDEYPDGWFEKAVDEAVAYGKRNLKYIAAILERWKREGFEPLQTGEKHEAGDVSAGMKVEE